MGLYPNLCYDIENVYSINKMMLKNIRFILVNTSHPGNIGSVARIMKNMALEKLFLVNPEKFPHENATAMASGATDILENANLTSSSDEAIKNCTLVIGTSARMRKLPQSMVTPPQIAKMITQEPKDHEIAFLFGNEKFGLNNEDLQKCHYHVRIPTVETFNSLNLAAAAQIIAYELYTHTLSDQGKSLLHTRENFATADELEGLYHHIQETMILIDFLNLKHPRQLMPRMRQIINRSRIDKDELNLLRGIMTAVWQSVKKEHKP
jgi:tRNA (cytidine32/uridine32-2'-O)-methyltransferase